MRSHKEQPSNMVWKYVEMEQCEKQIPGAEIKQQGQGGGFINCYFF